MYADAKHKEIEKQMKAHVKVYGVYGFIYCTKKAKSGPLEMGINCKDMALRGLKFDMSHPFSMKLEKRLNLVKMVSVIFTRGSKRLVYKILYDFNSNFV